MHGGLVETTLEYVSAGASYSLVVTRRKVVLRVVGTCVYMLLWIGFAAAAGSVGASFLGGSVFNNRLGPISDDDFFVVGAILGPLLASPLAWVARRSRWFHFLTIVTGVLGFGFAAVAVARLAAERRWLWELVTILLGLVALAFAVLALAGIAGLLVSRSSARRPVDDRAC